jgi:hypothetical protein
VKNKRYFVLAISLIFVGILFSGCGSGAPKPAEPITAKEIADQKKVINEYYQAIGQGKYRVAYNLTSLNFQKGTSYKNFVFQYKQYVASVKIKSIARLTQYSDKDDGVFNVTFNVVYKQKYPYFNGKLPGVHVLQREKKKSPVWRIDSIGVGQFG